MSGSSRSTTYAFNRAWYGSILLWALLVTACLAPEQEPVQTIVGPTTSLAVAGSAPIEDVRPFVVDLVPDLEFPGDSARLASELEESRYLAFVGLKNPSSPRILHA
jgi:hypothetical protein